MTKDHLDGAELLTKRVRRKVQYMPYQQVMDEGGLLAIMAAEYVKMVDEWTNEEDIHYEATYGAKK